jgi:hypothetical protein
MDLRNPERVASKVAESEPRRNPFRVAKTLLGRFYSQGFKANPGLELANASSVNYPLRFWFSAPAVPPSELAVTQLQLGVRPHTLTRTPENAGVLLFELIVQ